MSINVNIILNLITNNIERGDTVSAVALKYTVTPTVCGIYK